MRRTRLGRRRARAWSTPASPFRTPMPRGRPSLVEHTVVTTSATRTRIVISATVPGVRVEQIKAGARATLRRAPSTFSMTIASTTGNRTRNPIRRRSAGTRSKRNTRATRSQPGTDRWAKKRKCGRRSQSSTSQSSDPAAAALRRTRMRAGKRTRASGSTDEASERFDPNGLGPELERAHGSTVRRRSSGRRDHLRGSSGTASRSTYPSMKKAKSRRPATMDNHDKRGDHGEQKSTGRRGRPPMAGSNRQESRPRVRDSQSPCPFTLHPSAFVRGSSTVPPHYPRWRRGSSARWARTCGQPRYHVRVVAPLSSPLGRRLTRRQRDRRRRRPRGP